MSEILHAPILLGAGERLEGRRFWLADDFAWNSWQAVVYIGNSADVVISDCEFYGSPSWRADWNTSPGSGRSAIRAQGAPGLVIQQVHVEGFPRYAIEGFGWERALFKDITVTRCFGGILAMQYGLNPHMYLFEVHVEDTWGPPNGSWSGVENLPSLKHPGATMGSDGIAMLKVSDSEIIDCSCTGEQFGSLKLLNPQRVTIKRFRGTNGMIHGLVAGIDTAPSRDSLFLDCVFDKALGAGKAVESANGFQLSEQIDSVLFRECSFLNAGKNGHGTQLAVDVKASFVDCTFKGWNGTRGSQPACAAETETRSKINADFKGANLFVDQQRILMENP